MKFLVIGGAGYIGSHFLAEAVAGGHDCLVYDNLSTGFKESIPKSVRFIRGDILDQTTLEATIKSFEPDAIFHYAALCLVGESVIHPDLYYKNNVNGVMTLLDAMVKTKTLCNLIFSSSCAVFGIPTKLPLAEDAPKNPISPYGRSKLMAECIIEDYARAYNFKAIALRYFNACGAHESSLIGEAHNPESHLIPNIIKSYLNGKKFVLYGNNFPTPDGTCIRDYIHVTDLAISHLKAVDYLKNRADKPFTAIHLGTGKGYSNLEILDNVSRIIGKELDPIVVDPRKGDPAELYADNEIATNLLDFKPQHSSLSNIIATALRWHQNQPSWGK